MDALMEDLSPVEFIAKTRAIKIMNNDLKRENYNILNQQASDLVVIFEG